MTQAVILAGGRGTRLASVAKGLPKPLVPVAGVPVVQRQIEILVRYGVDEIFLTTGYKAEVLESQLGDGSRFGARLHYVREEEPLGTAGGVAALRDRLAGDFLVVYGDVMIYLDLARLLDFHRNAGADATIVVHPNDHPFDSDLVDLDEGGRVRGFHPAPRPQDGPDLPNMVSAALYVLTPRAFEHIEPGAKQDFVRDVFPRMMAEDAALYGYHTTEYLKDMGTPDRLAKVEAAVESGLVEAMHADHPRPTLFIDRDGVVNREIDGVLDADRLELLPGSGAAIRRLNKTGWLAALVTNQPFIAKGQMAEEDLARIHRRLERLLGDEGAWLDGIGHCPHHPDKGFEGERPELKVVCECRKPAPGMLARHAERLPVDCNRAAMVGDSWRDMGAAHAFGIPAIGVRSGHALRVAPPEEHAATCRPDVMVEDLAHAVALVVDRDPGVEAVAEQIEARLAGGAARPLPVLIGGLSRAGKSTSTFRLAQRLRAAGLRPLTVRLDDWVMAASERWDTMTVVERFRVPALESALARLRVGSCVEAPGYDPMTREQALRPTSYDPTGADVLLLEGVVALLVSAADPVLRVAVDVPTEEERLRRVRHFYAYKGMVGPEVDAVLAGRSEEHETVAASARDADLRFTPNPLAPEGPADRESQQP